MTSFHKIMELAAGPNLVNSGAMATKLSIELLEDFYTQPKFVLDINKIIHSADDIRQTVEDLQEADQFSPPYPKFSVEYTGIPKDHYLFLFEYNPDGFPEANGERHIKCCLTYLSKNEDGISTAGLINAKFYLRYRRGFGVDYHAERLYNDGATDLSFTAFSREWSGHIAVAYGSLLAFLATRGMEREVVSSTKLNKRRATKGKLPIPDYIRVYPKVAYNRKGEPVPLGQSKRTHWRRGHIRRQKYGPGWSNERIIFIQPVLVNYTEGEKPTFKEYRVQP